MSVGLVCDLILQIPIGSVVVKAQFCHLFLYYLLFRRDFKHVFVVFIYYLIIVMPFTGVSVLAIFLSLIVVLIVIWHLHAQIYTESYLVQSLWTMIMNIIQQLLLTFLIMRDWKLLVASFTLINILVNAGVMFLLTIPFFIAWDNWYGRWQKTLQGRRDVDPTDSLRRKRYGDMT